LIQLLEKTDNSHSLRVLLDALTKIGSHDFAKALEKTLSNEPLIAETANWARDHHATELRAALEQVVEHPPPGVRRTVDLAVVSEALGVIGGEGSAAKVAARLDELSSKRFAEVGDQWAAMNMIGALAQLRCKPAGPAVARSFFYWFGIDSTFAANPQLMKLKEELQTEVEMQARKLLSEFQQVHAEALVFLQNRAALANGSETKPSYTFALEVAVGSQEKPETKAEALQARLINAFGDRGQSIGVTRWIRANYGESSGTNDERVGGRNDSLFLWRYAQYVHATGDSEDIRFIKFLLDSGLADRWRARDSIAEGLGEKPGS
jgi:hypothetical protein